MENRQPPSLIVNPATGEDRFASLDRIAQKDNVTREGCYRTPEFDTLGYEYVLNSISDFVAMNLPDLNSETIDRIIEMAWEDRTPFEAIEQQFGLQEKQVIALMRREMKASSFKMWRERVTGRKTKHLKQRDFVSGRFHSLVSERFLMGSDKEFGY